MVPPDVAGCDTAFTVSIDHRDAGSGIGAADRALTIRKILDPASRPDHFVRPGHVFPLRAREGGVLERRGHTEAAVDLARLAGLRAGRGDLRGAARRRLARPASRTSSCSRRSTASRWCRSTSSSSTASSPARWSARRTLLL